MASTHLSYEQFKEQFGDLGVTAWVKYNYTSWTPEPSLVSMDITSSMVKKFTTTTDKKSFQIVLPDGQVWSDLTDDLESVFLDCETFTMVYDERFTSDLQAATSLKANSNKAAIGHGDVGSKLYIRGNVVYSTPALFYETIKDCKIWYKPK